MDNIYVGKIVKTHGVKGEFCIISDFPYKEQVFVPEKSIILNDKEYKIKTYRPHKNYDMVTLYDYNDINEVLNLLKSDVYIKYEDLNLKDEVLDEELISYDVITTTNKKGYIKEIFYASKTNKILRIQLDNEVLIPFFSPMIQKIDKEKKQIIIQLLEEREV